MIENEITEKVIGAAIEVHRHLGPGLLESAYEECLCYEMSRVSLRSERQVHLPVDYKGLHLNCAYRMDLLVENLVIVEIKPVDSTLPIHQAQMLTYLKASGKRVGVLINFNVTVLKNGIKRLLNEYSGPDLRSPRRSPDLRVSAVKEEVR